MGVTKDLVQAYKQVKDDILSNFKYISEVIILAYIVNPNACDTYAYADKTANTTQCHNSVSDLRATGVKSIGKCICIHHHCSDKLCSGAALPCLCG